MSLEWEVFELANGLRLVVTPMPATQAASISVFVGVGSRSEPKELNGITHFLEHMVFKGTERRPDAHAIAEAIEGAGGTLNAYTNKEFTCYWHVVPFDHLDVALDVAADMVLHSKLDPEEIERERAVVQQELKRNHDHPQTWAARLVGMAVFGEQPVGWDVGGTLETVARVKREHFIDHIERWYRAPNAVVSVAGNVDPARVRELAEALFGEMRSGAVPAVPPYDPGKAGPRVVLDERRTDQCSVYLGFPGMSRHDPDRFALRVMNDILGSGMSSRLFREVRERRGLAYAVHSSYGLLADTGIFTIGAGVNRDRLVETIQVCLGEVRRLCEEPVGPEELRKAKEHTIGRFRLSLETAHAVGQRHGELLLTRGEIEPVENVVGAIDAVTAEDVQRVARRLFDPGAVHCAVVGPDLDEEELLAALAA